MTGAELRAWRLSRGWSQGELGRRLAAVTLRAVPYTQMTVSDWENGRRAPEIDLARAIKALDKRAR
jgi:transcriptional regulator with XRE-family HTH domain